MRCSATATDFARLMRLLRKKPRLAAERSIASRFTLFSRYLLRLHPSELDDIASTASPPPSSGVEDTGSLIERKPLIVRIARRPYAFERGDDLNGSLAPRAVPLAPARL